jgi:hypothetical protein
MTTLITNGLVFCLEYYIIPFDGRRWISMYDTPPQHSAQQFIVENNRPTRRHQRELLMIEKIISGGNEGSERAALDAAQKYGIPHSGWIHHMRAEERDKLLASYHLSIIPALDPRAAIRRNVMNADGTLILTVGATAGNTDYARHMTLKSGMQLLGIDLKQYSPLAAASLIASWLEMNHVKRVYITGPAEINRQSAYTLSRKTIEAAILLRLARPADGNIRETRTGNTDRTGKKWPKTVAEAVDMLISDLFLKDKTRISAMQPQELDALLPTLGMYIKETFGLLGGNHALIKSCMHSTHATRMIPDEACAIIIKSLWNKLQLTHKLRLVP